MLFTSPFPDSQYYLSPLFPEVDEIEVPAPVDVDETNRASQPEPQPLPPAKSIRNKKKIARVSDELDVIRSKSLLPLVAPERKRKEPKYGDEFYEKRTANWQKKWEERKRLVTAQKEQSLKVINDEVQRRIDFLNKFKGITFPANTQTK